MQGGFETLLRRDCRTRGGSWLDMRDLKTGPLTRMCAELTAVAAAFALPLPWASTTRLLTFCETAL